MSFERFHRSQTNLCLFQTVGYIRFSWTFTSSLQSERFVRPNIAYRMIYLTYNTIDFQSNEKNDFPSTSLPHKKGLIGCPSNYKSDMYKQSLPCCHGYSKVCWKHQFLAALFYSSEQTKMGVATYTENTGAQNSKNTEKFVYLYLQAKYGQFWRF